MEAEGWSNCWSSSLQSNISVWTKQNGCGGHVWVSCVYHMHAYHQTHLSRSCAVGWSPGQWRVNRALLVKRVMEVRVMLAGIWVVFEEYGWLWAGHERCGTTQHWLQNHLGKQWTYFSTSLNRGPGLRRAQTLHRMMTMLEESALSLPPFSSQHHPAVNLMSHVSTDPAFIYDTTSGDQAQTTL